LIQQKKGGVVYKGNEQWYWNGKYTGEFMIDSHLNLADLVKLDFVNHRRICSKNGNSCNDKNLSKFEAASVFLAIVIGKKLKHIGPSLLEKVKDDFNFHYTCLYGLRNLFLELAPAKNNKLLSLSDSEAEAIMTAALLMYGDRQYENSRILVECLSSKKFFYEIFEKIFLTQKNRSRNCRIKISNFDCCWS
jgi:hypothetical protein